MTATAGAPGNASMTSAGPEAPPPTLRWRIEDVAADRLAVVPALLFRLAIDSASGEKVQSVLLATSVRIATPLRGYDAQTRARLVGVFGQPHQWRDSLRELVWTQATVVVPAFTGATTVDIPVTCSADLDLAAVSYLHVLREGDVPLRFLFSGTMFYLDGAGRLRTAQIPWEAEADFTLPAGTWHRTRERYFGDDGWLRLPRETYDRLAAYRARRAFPSWQTAIDSLLPADSPAQYGEERHP